MSYMVIDSTPEPTPMSICPALILLATRATASNPLEQKRLTVTKVVVSGMPAKNPAILDVMAPAPGWLTLPTTMSSMSLGSTLVLSISPFKAVANKTSGAVSLSPPLLALVNGVLTAPQITTSLGLLGANPNNAKTTQYLRFGWQSFDLSS